VRRSSLITALATAVAMSLVMVLAAPAAAWKVFEGEHGFHARFGPSMSTDVRGLVIGDRLGGDNPRLTVGLVGLLPQMEFNIVGRSIGCGGMPSEGNRVFKVNAMANAHGDWFGTRILAEWGSTALRSVWINWGDGAACQRSLNFEEIKVNIAASDNGEGGLALTKEGAGTLIMLLEKRPNDQARLNIVVGGLDGNDELRIRLVNRQCGKTPTNTLVSDTLTDILISGFRTTTVPLTQDELDSIRSMRVTNLSDNNKWDCGPVSMLIGLFIP